MTLKCIISGIVHHARRAEVIARPWFRVLNFHQEQFACTGFAASLSLAKHLVKDHKS